MTARLIRSWGLTAGLTGTEAGLLAPGEVVDLYVYRRRYDDEQHQIERKQEQACYD